MLQEQQRIVDNLVHWAMRNDANNAAHGGAPSKNRSSGHAGFTGTVRYRSSQLF
jgi:hypothetical protein